MQNISDILEQRKTTHGLFKDHAGCTQDLMSIAMEGNNWHMLSPEYKEALHMVFHKIARILTGAPYHRDHVDDIIGYATLMQKYVDERDPLSHIHTTYSDPINGPE